MSKPRAAKRTKSYAADSDTEEEEERSANDLLDNLDLGDRSTTPKVVAAALLSLLPKDATKQHSSAKALTKAFPLVVAELEGRANRAARKLTGVGASQPIKFSFADEESDEIVATVDLPEETFVHILSFLDGYQLVDASLVSKAWLSSSRLPSVWEDGLSIDNLNRKKQFNMTGLLKVLSRPQFANVKAFCELVP